uniref:Retrovirus-related Pol polyprotein from transposon TNT 1-94 n=1 Tax=Tanacetum cinerariifolium TaxID=118510 RepID=A0A6L2LLA3_TANCI|nr:retrovirus-related Pol polyprotein from transposon TNT 1-94 [Tanacetum cinerariifolium]
MAVLRPPSPASRPPATTTPPSPENFFGGLFFGEPKKNPNLSIYPIYHITRPHTLPHRTSAAAATTTSQPPLLPLLPHHRSHTALVTFTPRHHHHHSRSPPPPTTAVYPSPQRAFGFINTQKGCLFGMDSSQEKFQSAAKKRRLFLGLTAIKACLFLCKNDPRGAFGSGESKQIGVFVWGGQQYRGRLCGVSIEKGSFYMAYPGYSFVSKAFRVFNTRRQQVKETYHVTFDESMEAIRFTNTSQDEIIIDDSFRYPPNESLYEDDPSRKYQINFDVLYYVIPHGCLLTELTKENLVPEVIALNKLDIPLIEDNEGPLDLINTKGTHKQNV